MESGTSDVPVVFSTSKRVLAECVGTRCTGYWCRLWLAYNHVVLLAVDLLRMHNNKPFFKDTKCEAGFFKILDMPDNPVDQQQH